MLSTMFYIAQRLRVKFAVETVQNKISAWNKSDKFVAPIAFSSS